MQRGGTREDEAREDEEPPALAERAPARPDVLKEESGEGLCSGHDAEDTCLLRASKPELGVYVDPVLIVFEIYVRPGFDGGTFLSDEAREETQARVMTRAEIDAEGLGELPAPSREGAEVRYVPVNARHRRWIERAIDESAMVDAFDVHDVGG